MPLPSSGQITLDEMHVEAGGSTTTQGAVNDADIRALIGAASGGPNLAFTDWYGASARVTINITISSNTNNYNLFNSKGGTYSAGNTTINVTINSGVTVGSVTTFGYAFTTGTGWATGDVINIINNGTIKGKGGSGGAGADITFGGANNNTQGGNGATGGPAFRGQFACTVTNNGSVYGGGGGGGGGGGFWLSGDGKITFNSANAGSGGGGGAGVNGGSGGTGGTASGAGAVQGTNGSAGSSTAGGSGGTGGYNGGNGGGLGANGAIGQSASNAGGTGGTRGAYQVGASLINGGSGIGGTVGGRSL